MSPSSESPSSESPSSESPSSHHAAGRGGSIFALVFLLCVAALGAWLVRDGSRERGLAAARPVEVTAAREAASDPAPVRLRGLLVGLPTPPTTADGEVYAVQMLRMTHDEGSGEDRETVTDYHHRLPQELFLSAGDSAIAIDAEKLDEGYLPTIWRARTDYDGRLPDSLVRLVATGFTGIPARRTADVELAGIRAADTVNVYGTVVLRDGFPVVVAPSNGDPLIVSSAPYDEIQREVARNDWWTRLFGWVLVAMGVVGAWAVWWFGLRARGATPAGGGAVERQLNVGA